MVERMRRPTGVGSGLGALPRPGPRVRITRSPAGSSSGLANSGESSMVAYLQAGRALTVTTPLDRDALLLVGFAGQEAISQPFEFRLDLLAENATAIPFEQLLGQKIVAHLTVREGETRHFGGICKSIRQGGRDATFTAYQLEVVPQFWLLTKKAQSRIFQQLTVPEILAKVLAGLDVAFELK